MRLSEGLKMLLYYARWKGKERRRRVATLLESPVVAASTGPPTVSQHDLLVQLRLAPDGGRRRGEDLSLKLADLLVRLASWEPRGS